MCPIMLVIYKKSYIKFRKHAINHVHITEFETGSQEPGT